jgi:hypothetical protein
LQFPSVSRFTVNKKAQYSYDAIARRSRRGSAASSVREVRDSFNRKRFGIRLVD